jgi:hypothetical protein
MGRGNRKTSTKITSSLRTQKDLTTQIMEDLYNLSITEKEILQANLRPKASSISGFISKTDNMFEIIESDIVALAAVDTTPQKVGMRLQAFLLASVPNVRDRASRNRLNIPDHINITFGSSLMGKQGCPFEQCGFKCNNNDSPLQIRAGFGSWNFDIHNKKIDERIQGPGLLTHLAVCHNFFEGNTAYRVDPIRLARVIEVIGS